MSLDVTTAEQDALHAYLADIERASHLAQQGLYAFAANYHQRARLQLADLETLERIKESA